jgi:hypothetical protein
VLFRRATFAITAAVCLLSAAAHAAPVSEPEPNEPFAAAQNVDAFFSLVFDPNIENFAGVNTSTTVSHVEVVSPGDASGTTVNASSALNFATFSIHARHTPLTDNDPAFTVASAFPNLHATASLEDGQFFAWNQTAQSFAFRAIIETNSFYIPFSAITAPPIMRTCGSCPNPLARPLCSRVA